MYKILSATILPSLLITGLLAMSAQAHDGSGKHYVVDSSGNPVKSSSGCITSSGTGGKHSEACGDGESMAKAEMAPVPAAPAPAPAPVMMKSAMAPKVMGASHSHPANHCTRSMVHTHAHAGAGGHTHRYSCKSNKMASPRQMVKMSAPSRHKVKMASPRQKAKY